MVRPARQGRQLPGGIYLGYVSRVDTPWLIVACSAKEWPSGKVAAPSGRAQGNWFQDRHELMLEMLDEPSVRAAHAWVAGDDELGRSSWFRQELQRRNERYLLAVPSNTLVRDLKVRSR